MKSWKLVLTVLLGFFIASYIFSALFGGGRLDSSDKIAIIPIKGTITLDDSQIFLFGEGSTKSDDIIESIEEANKDNRVKGIILAINSPGGTVVASKPVVAWIREFGASGAFWIATAADKIVADRLSITGSIGVTGSYLEFSGLLNKYGIKYQELAAGEYKDSTAPFKELTPNEKELIQKKLNAIHDLFIENVAANRNLEKENVRKMANGLFYLGQEAYDLKLIDYLGGRELAINITKQLAGLGDAKIVELEKRKGIVDLLERITSRASYFVGKGISSNIAVDDRFRIFS
jgi:protease IV